MVGGLSSVPNGVAIRTGTWLDLKDRGEPRLLIDSDALEDQPAFSPDGTSIAFVSTFSGNADIYLLRFRPDRTLTALMAEAQNVTHHMSGDFRPAFSPDGRSLAFSSDRDLPINAISPIIRLRDGDLSLDLQDSRLTRLTNAPGWMARPARSPDGKTIVYYHAQPRTAATWRATTSQIWSMNADATNQRVLTPNEATALSPTFLGDGRVAYSRKPADGAHWQIVSIGADGSEERIESDPSSNDYWAPSWGHAAGMLVAHGTGPYSPADDVVRTPWTANIGEGPFLAAGAPFGKRLANREIKLYPIRFFTALLNPKKDLVLLTTPPGGTSCSSRGRRESTTQGPAESTRRKTVSLASHGRGTVNGSPSRAATRGIATRTPTSGEFGPMEVSRKT